MAGGDFRSQGVIGSGVFPKPAGAQPGDVFVAVTNVNLLALGFPGPGWVQHGSVDQLAVFSKLVVGDEPAFLASGIPATARGVVACYEACAVEAVSLYQSSGRAAPYDQTTLKGLAAHPYSSGQRFVAGVLLSSNQSIPTVADPSGFAARYTAGVLDPQASDRTTVLALTDRPVKPGAEISTQTLTVNPGTQATIQSKLSVGLLLRPHNSPPYAPEPTTPPVGAALDQGRTNRFGWRFADPDDGDVQSRYEHQIRSTAAGAAWTSTGEIDSPFSFRDYGPGSLQVGFFEWRARTWDRYGFVGEWSGPRPFSVAAQPVGPVITSPVNGETITEPWVDLVWSVPEQDATQYRVLADSPDGTADTTNVIFDSGELGPAAYRTVRVPLPDNRTIRHLQVRSKKNGLWSIWDSVRVPVEFTVPPEPLVVIDENDPKGAISVSGIVRAPLGGQPAVVTLEVWRRAVGDDGPGGPVATVTPDGSLVDWEVASDEDYEYRLLATAATGATTWSQWRRSKDLTGVNRAYGNIGDFLDADSVLLWEADNATLEWTDMQGIGDPGALKIITTTGGLPVMVRPVDAWDAVFGVTYTTIIQVRDGGQRRLIRLRRRWFGEAGQLLREDLGVPVEETAAASTGAPEVDVSYQLRVATSPTRSPSDPLAGAALTQPVAVFVEPATGVTAVEWSVDDAVTSVDTSAPFDLAGGSDTSAVLYDPAALPPGPHTIKAVLTLASGAFRTLIGSVTRPALPNMVVEAVTWSPQSPTAGQKVTFAVTVRNDGVGPKPAGIPTGVPVKVDGVTVGYDDQHVAAIPPGETVTIPLTTYLPAPTTGWSATAGTHQVTAQVNDVRRYEETAYDDAYSATLTVGSSAAPAPPPPTGPTMRAYPVQDYLDSVGAAVHLVYSQYQTSSSANAAGRAQLIECLLYLGINRIRDGWGTGRGELVAWLLNTVQPALGGLEMSMVHDSRDFGLGKVGGDIALGRLMRDTHKASGLTQIMKWAEGANEWDSTLSIAKTLAGHVADAYHEDPATDDVLVGSMSFASLNNEALYTGHGRLDKLDFGTSHPYPGNNYVYDDAIMDRVDRHFAHVVPGKPVILTETGTTTVFQTDVAYEGQPDDAHRRFIPMLALDAFRRGRYQGSIRHERTYFYELYDKSPTASGNKFEKFFGLFRNDRTPKAGATSLNRLHGLLADPGTRPPQRDVGVQITGGDAKTKSVLLAKSDGTVLLIIWQQERVFNGSQVLNPPDRTVTVTFEATPTGITRHQPTTTAAPVTITPASSIQVTSSEDITVLTIGGI